MILAASDDEINIDWKPLLHNPTLTNNMGYTVALLLASKGIVPPKEWEHDKLMKNDKE